MDKALCTKALDVITQGKDGTNGHTVKEMGNTFYSSEGNSHRHSYRSKMPTVWLPKEVKELISTAQSQLGYQAPQWDRINVIHTESTAKEAG